METGLRLPRWFRPVPGIRHFAEGILTDISYSFSAKSFVAPEKLIDAYVPIQHRFVS